MDFMNNPRLVVLTIGISGSGKSTLIDQLYGSIPHVRLNRDSVRKELCGNEEDHSREVMVNRLIEYRLKSSLKDPSDTRPIIIDNTNIRYADRKDYYRMMNEVGLEIGKDVKLLFILFELTPEVAMKRQLKRDRLVPREAVERQHRRLARPQHNEKRDGIPYRMVTINDHGTDMVIKEK